MAQDGTIQESALVRRMIAPNPGPFTGPGTNTYLVGAGEHVACIDPGPDDPAHIDRVLEGAEEAHAFIDLILVTHHHIDHLPGAWLLRDRVRAPVATHSSISKADRVLAHGQRIPLGGCTLEALFTPGHAGDHFCFLMDDGSLFSGDLIVGRGTVVIRPPDGDMDDYLESLQSLRAYGIHTILPGHWPRVDDPAAKITEYIDHRHDREREVLAALRAGEGTPTAIAARIYRVLDARLRGAAQASVAAHLISLERRGIVRTIEKGEGRVYELTSRDG